MCSKNKALCLDETVWGVLWNTYILFLCTILKIHVLRNTWFFIQKTKSELSYDRAQHSGEISLHIAIICLFQ